MARVGVEPTGHQGLSLAALPVCVPCLLRFRHLHNSSAPDGIRTHDLHLDRVASTPGCSARAFDHAGQPGDGSGGIRTLSISRSEREWSASCLPSHERIMTIHCVNDLDRTAQGGSRTHIRPGLSRAARPVGVPGRLPRSSNTRAAPQNGSDALPRRKPWDSNPQADFAATRFQDGPLIRPVGFRRSIIVTANLSSSGGWNRTSGLHVQSVASLPPATAPESLHLIYRFGKEDSNLHRLIQSQGACRLADSRVSLLIFHLLIPTTLRDRGFEPRLPGWKPGVVPLDQPRVTDRATLQNQRKERELNPQGSSLARFRIGCRRRSACPSVPRERNY